MPHSVNNGVTTDRLVGCIGKALVEAASTRDDIKIASKTHGPVREALITGMSSGKGPVLLGFSPVQISRAQVICMRCVMTSRLAEGRGWPAVRKNFANADWLSEAGLLLTT